MEKISVTRALAELKVLKKRIESKVESMVFVDVYQNKATQLARSKKPKQEFEDDAKAALQAVNDMTSRYRRIKDAIVSSNAKTIVSIGGEKMTVASAIEQKKSIEMKKLLHKKALGNWVSCGEIVDRERLSMEDSLEKLLVAMYGSDKKTDSSMFEETSKSFRQQNEVKMFDPVGIEKMVAKLEKQITEFEGEVDFVLSESNAKTEIEI